MCGIAGICRLSDKPLPDIRILKEMLKVIGHRGPDDTGFFSDDHIQMGVVRLSIIDVESGNQPVHGCNKRIVGGLNGEIYNYKHLRNLLGNSHFFNSNSDSVVIPHLYEEYGINFIRLLQGMYGLALWDGEKRELVLARDRVGIKPLFYARTESYFLFSSEIKAIAVSGLVPMSIDFKSLSDLFGIGYPISPRTMFKNIYELKPGHHAVIATIKGDIKSERYWEVPFRHLGDYRKVSFKDAASEFDFLMKETIRSHLQSDVPLSCFLSGGIDSSAICAWTKEVTGSSPSTFSVGFDLFNYDETSHSKRVAQHLETHHESLIVTNEMVNRYTEFIWHVELPMVFPVALPLWMLSEKIRDRGFKVVLSGEGADEIFGGYDCFRQYKMNMLFKSGLAKKFRPLLYRQLYKWRNVPEEIMRLFLDNHEAEANIMKLYHGLYPPWYDVWSLLKDRGDIFNPSIEKQIRDFSSVPEEINGLFRDDISMLHPFDQALSFEMVSRLPSWILLNTDRVTMAASIESRVPFLDHKVVEFVAQLHPEMKMRFFSEKALLREAVKKYLPRETVTRRKQPFFSPIREYFFSDQTFEVVDNYLSHDKINDFGLFNDTEVQRLRKSLKEKKESSLSSYQMEWKLILILGTQILYDLFCKRSIQQVK